MINYLLDSSGKFVPFITESFGAVDTSPQLFFSLKRTKDWFLLAVEIFGYNGTTQLDPLLWGGSWTLKINEQPIFQTKKLGELSPSSGFIPIRVKRGSSLSLILQDATNYSFFIRFIGAEAL